jgi:hypothetical protein
MGMVQLHPVLFAPEALSNSSKAARTCRVLGSITPAKPLRINAHSIHCICILGYKYFKKNKKILLKIDSMLM